MESRKPYADPFNDVDVDVIFSKDGQSWRVPTFWRGGRRWTVRFSPPTPGEYTYRLQSTDPDNPDLNGHEGRVRITAYRGANELLQHGMLRVSANKRYFEHADGTPFLWLADTWWTGLSHRLSWEGFRKLTADRKSKGFTVVQTVAGLIPDEELPPVDPGYRNEGGPVWDAQFKRINPKYFDYADRRIQHLIDMGIVPAIVGAWRDLLTYMGIAKMKKHWRYVVARYGAYPVFWIVGGEVLEPPDGMVSQLPDVCKLRVVHGWTEVARYLRAIDPYHHPMTIHEFPIPCDFPLQDESLMDFNLLQASHKGWESIAVSVTQLDRQYVRSSAIKPTVQGEIGYEKFGETHLEDFQRTAFWLSLLNGAAGHTYGAVGTWEAYTADKLFQRQRFSFLTWEEGMRLPGSYQVGLGAMLLKKYPWWNFAPHPEWITPRGKTFLEPQNKDPGFTEFDPSSWELSESQDDLANAEVANGTPEARQKRKWSFRRAYAAGIPGEVRVIYMPFQSPSERKPPTVLRLEPGVLYRAYFWQPALGMQIDLGAVEHPAPAERIFSGTLSKEAAGVRVDHVRGYATLRGEQAVVRILKDVNETNAVARVEAESSAPVVLVLRYKNGENFVCAAYLPVEKLLYLLERRNGADGSPLGQTYASDIGSHVRLSFEVRNDKAIASISDEQRSFTTPIVDLTTVSAGTSGLLFQSNDSAGKLGNFELRRSPDLVANDSLPRKLYDARGTYRGDLRGSATAIASLKVPGWGDFGRDKHILLDAYRPERMPTIGDWVLVLEATHPHEISPSSSTTH